RKSTETRTAKGLVMEVEDRFFVNDEVISVPVTVGSLQDVLGYQLTMSTGNLSFLDIEPGIFNIDGNQVGVFEKAGKLTMSFAAKSPIVLNPGDVLFTMKFKAKSEGQVSQMLSINDDITKPESYDSQYQVGNVDLRFNQIGGDAFVLYQNEPNPFISHTVVTWYQPKASEVTLTLYDVQGHQIKQFRTEGIQGMNGMNLSKQDVGVTGVLYYTLEYGNETATKKMIIVE
ncbi:MAG: T9SS type A sorting domain-containing protein, partial [Chitinophagales bacterium]|nr:T9SS type A sorting domain-containing protein [Chitinophagales bacterium]